MRAVIAAHGNKPVDACKCILVGFNQMCEIGQRTDSDDRASLLSELAAQKGIGAFCVQRTFCIFQKAFAKAIPAMGI